MSETATDHGYVCARCDGAIDDIVELVMHSDDADCERPVRLHAASLSRRERNTLIYMENQVIDHAGKLYTDQINEDDFQNIKLLQAAGLVEVADAETDPDDPPRGIRQVESFTDEAWDLARDCRQIRADVDDRVDFAIGDPPAIPYGHIDVYGHSDDLIEVTGIVQEELYANYGEDTQIRVGPYLIEAKYGAGGVWTFQVDAQRFEPGVGFDVFDPYDDPDDVPEGEVGYNSYSATVRIHNGREGWTVEKVEE